MNAATSHSHDDLGMLASLFTLLSGFKLDFVSLEVVDFALSIVNYYSLTLQGSSKEETDIAQAIAADVLGASFDLLAQFKDFSQYFPLFHAAMKFLFAVPFALFAGESSLSMCDRIFPFFPAEVTKFLSSRWAVLPDSPRSLFLASVGRRLQFVSDPAVAARWCQIAMKTRALPTDKDGGHTVGFLHFTSALYLRGSPESDALADVFARYLLRTSPDGENIVGSCFADWPPVRRARFVKSIPSAYLSDYSKFFGDLPAAQQTEPVAENPILLYEAPEFVLPTVEADLPSALDNALFRGGYSKLASLFKRASEEQWPIAAPATLPEFLFQRLVKLGVIAIPADRAVDYVRTKCRKQAVRHIQSDRDGFLSALRTSPKIKSEKLLSFCSVLAEVTFSSGPLIEFGLSLLRDAHSLKRYRVSLRVFAAVVHRVTDAVTPDLFVTFATILNADFQNLPFLEVAFCLIAFSPKMASDPRFVHFTYRAMRQGSLFLLDGAYFRAILRPHWSDLAKNRRLHANEFDPLILDLIGSAFPSQVQHGISLLEMGKVGSAIKPLILAFLNFVTLPIIGPRAARLLRKRKLTEVPQKLIDLFHSDASRAEFGAIASLVPVIARADTGVAVRTFCERLIEMPTSLVDFEIALKFLEEGIAALRPRERRVRASRELAGRWLAGLVRTDGYATMSYVRRLSDFLIGMDDSLGAFQFLCTEFVSRAPRFFSIFPVMAHWYLGNRDNQWASECLAMAGELVPWKAQKLAIAELRNGEVQRAMELARLESDEAESITEHELIQLPPR
jgi:hypothetical protein